MRKKVKNKLFKKDIIRLNEVLVNYYQDKWYSYILSLDNFKVYAYHWQIYCYRRYIPAPCGNKDLCAACIFYQNPYTDWNKYYDPRP